MKSDLLWNNMCWLWLGSFKDEFYTLSQEEGLKLYSMSLKDNLKELLWNYSNVLTQKLLGPNFIATIQINYSNLLVNEYGGIGLIGNSHYAFLSIKRTKTIYKIQLIKSNMDDNMTERVEYESFIHMENKTLFMQIQYTQEEGGKLGILNHKKEFLEIGCFKTEEETWEGVRLGLFSISLNNDENFGYMRFENFELDKINT